MRRSNDLTLRGNVVLVVDAPFYSSRKTTFTFTRLTIWHCRSIFAFCQSIDFLICWITSDESIVVDLTIMDSFKSCTSNDLKEKLTFTMEVL